jgi:hypothetical protein
MADSKISDLVAKSTLADTDLFVIASGATNNKVLRSVMATELFRDGSNDIVIENSTQDKDIIFKVNDGGTNTEVMRIDGSVSRIGINTASPTQRISVGVSQTGTEIICGQYAGSNTASDLGNVSFAGVDNGGVARAYMQVSQEWDGSFTDYALKFFTTDGGAGGAERFRITGSGKLTSGAETGACSEDSVGFSPASYVTNEITTDTSSSLSAFHIVSLKKSGTGTTTFGNTANIFTVANQATTRFLIKGNGDIHATNTTITALDDHDDIDLLKTAKNIMEKKTGHDKNHVKVLKDTGIFNEDQSLIGLQKMNKFHTDTLVQIYNMIKGVAKKANITEKELKAMAKVY